MGWGGKPTMSTTAAPAGIMACAQAEPRVCRVPGVTTTCTQQRKAEYTKRPQTETVHVMVLAAGAAVGVVHVRSRTSAEEEPAECAVRVVWSARQVRRGRRAKCATSFVARAHRVRVRCVATMRWCARVCVWCGGERARRCGGALAYAPAAQRVQNSRRTRTLGKA